MNPTDQANLTDATNSYARLSRELDIPEDKLRNYRNKWSSGQAAVSDKERAAYAAFDAHPETYGKRTQDSASLAKDLTNRGGDNFQRNEGGPHGETR